MFSRKKEMRRLRLTTAEFLREIKTIFSNTFKMAQICKLTYSEAFQTYQLLELFRERLSTRGKNEFHLVRRILEHHGIFLIVDTILPINPTVSVYFLDFIFMHLFKMFTISMEFERISCFAKYFERFCRAETLRQLIANEAIWFVHYIGSLFKRDSEKEKKNKQKSKENQISIDKNLNLGWYLLVMTKFSVTMKIQDN